MKIDTQFYEMRLLRQNLVYQGFYKVWEPDFIEFPLSMRVCINRDFYNDQSYATIERWNESHGWLNIFRVGIDKLTNMRKVSRSSIPDENNVTYEEKYNLALFAAMQDADNLLETALQIIK